MMMIKIISINVQSVFHLNLIVTELTSKIIIIPQSINIYVKILEFLKKMLLKSILC